MSRIYNYRRLYTDNRIPGRIIDVGNAGAFPEVAIKQCIPREECRIGGSVFRSIHNIIQPLNNVAIFTAFRCDEKPDVFLIVWKDYPFYPHIEEGGDFMLQVLATDKTVKHLIIDNTYVRSGWMNDQMSDYLNNGWIPGLIELELNAFCHLQAETYLGGLSFKKFGELVSDNISTIAQKLGKKPFHYYPIKTSDIAPDGKIDDKLRAAALKKALSILK